MLRWSPGTSVGQSADNAAHEVCYHTTTALNRELNVHPRTFYFSFVARRVTVRRALASPSWLHALCGVFRALCLCAAASLLRRGSGGAEERRVLRVCGLIDEETDAVEDETAEPAASREGGAAATSWWTA